MVNAANHRINLEYEAFPDGFEIFMHCIQCGKETTRVGVKRNDDEPMYTIKEKGSESERASANIGVLSAGHDEILPTKIEEYWWGFFVSQDCK